MCHFSLGGHVENMGETCTSCNLTCNGSYIAGSYKFYIFAATEVLYLR